MLSPTINNMILRLFDNASQGTASLLSTLRELFQCESIALSTKLNDCEAANDIPYQVDTEWPIKKHHDAINFNSNHTSLKLLNDHSRQLILMINQEENVYLKIHFQTLASLKTCLNSSDITTLVPHIQQAILIADKISQQQGDIDSLNYVISNHPCNVFSNIAPNSTPSISHLESANKESANAEVNLDVDRELLINFFSFTPTEAELAKQLFKGYNLQEIAEHRCVSKQTIRKQLQSILKKTQCDSQEALILIIFDAMFTGLNKTKPIAQALSPYTIKSPTELGMDETR